MRSRKDLPDVVARYLEGEPVKTLAQEFGVAPQTIRNRLSEAGIEGPGKGCPGKQKSLEQRAKMSAAKRISVDNEKIQVLAQSGASCQEIGHELGVSAETIRRRLVELEVPRLPAQARPEHNFFWKGGRTQDKDGYWLIHQPEHPFANSGGYVREHRLIMEKKVGRYLTREEVVGHKNGCTWDNDPDNLLLFPNNAEHLKSDLSGRKRVHYLGKYLPPESNPDYGRKNDGPG